MPFANVEVAEPVTLRAPASMPPAKVLVPVLVTSRFVVVMPLKVEVLEVATN
jgi:hypothetical protein